MIEIRNLKKAFGTQEVLRGVDLTFEAGKITAILGPSGEGKSVLLKTMMGLLRPDAGEIHIEGEEICRLTPKGLNRVRRKIGMLFQDAALFDYMDVFENVSFPLYEHTRLSDAEVEQRVDERLEEVGLQNVNQKLPNELSGGMRKRVGLARALMLDPKILYFDEPTTGLDPIITDQIADLIENTHQRRHVTVVLITHDLPLAYRLADSIAMLKEGRIIEIGTPKQFRNSKNPFVQTFIHAHATPAELRD